MAEIKIKIIQYICGSKVVGNKGKINEKVLFVFSPKKKNKNKIEFQ